MITDSYSEAEKFNTALDAENYELAGTLLRAGLEKNPDDFVWLTAAGNLHFTQRHYERAESFYRRALSLEPQDSTALCNLAGVLYETGRYDEALILAENAFCGLPMRSSSPARRSAVPFRQRLSNVIFYR